MRLSLRTRAVGSLDGMPRAGAWRREGGQIAADTMGLMLLAALFVAALAVAGVPERVAFTHGVTESTAGLEQLVLRVGRVKAEQIVWRALTEHLEPDSGFEDFRVAMLDAAAELYGPDGSEEQDVDEAFATVGLDGSWEAPEQDGC